MSDIPTPIVRAVLSALRGVFRGHLSEFTVKKERKAVSIFKTERERYTVDSERNSS